MKAAIATLQPHQLTALMIGGLVADWRKRLRRNTVARYRSILQQFLSVLTTFGAPAIRAPKVPPATPRPTVATGQELATLIAKASNWMRLYMLLYFQCGLRRAETLRVTPRAWNREQHTVTIQVKGGHTRTAQLTEEAELLMASAGEQPPDRPYLEAIRGKTITPAGLVKAWTRHRKACGVNPALFAHDLRRTAASILYAATKDLRAAQQLLGHKKLESTLTYLSPLAPEEARRYAELLRFDKFQSHLKQ